MGPEAFGIIPGPAVISVRPSLPAGPGGGSGEETAGVCKKSVGAVVGNPGQHLSGLRISRTGWRREVHTQLGSQIGPDSLSGLPQPVVHLPKNHAHPGSAPQPSRTPTRPAPTLSIHRMSSQQRIQRRTRPAFDGAVPRPRSHGGPHGAAQHSTQPVIAGLMHTRAGMICCGWHNHRLPVLPGLVAGGLTGVGVTAGSSGLAASEIPRRRDQGTAAGAFPVGGAGVAWGSAKPLTVSERPVTVRIGQSGVEGSAEDEQAMQRQR